MYDPANWYWLADDGRLYSSINQSLIEDTDPGYLAWRAQAAPTRWPVDEDGMQSDTALAAVLAPYGLSFGLPTLDEVKAKLKAAVDTAAEADRLKYITPGAGQALTYSQKADEAKRYLAATDPDPTDYPLLSAEVGITAPDLIGVARIVNAAFAQWQIIGAAIEKTRLATKAAIEDAATAEEAQAVLEGGSWPVI